MQSPDDYLAKCSESAPLDVCADCEFNEVTFNLIGAQNLGPWILPMGQGAATHNQGLTTTQVG